MQARRQQLQRALWWGLGLFKTEEERETICLCCLYVPALHMQYKWERFTNALHVSFELSLTLTDRWTGNCLQPFSFIPTSHDPLVWLVSFQSIRWAETRKARKFSFLETPWYLTFQYHIPTKTNCLSLSLSLPPKLTST